MMTATWIVMSITILLFSVQLFRKYNSAFGALVGIYGALLFIFPGLERLSDQISYLGELMSVEDIIYQNTAIALFFAICMIITQLVPARSTGIRNFTGYFNRVDGRALTVCFLLLLLVSYAANVVLYGDPLYLTRFGTVDRFSAMMANAKGAWYLVMLSQLAMIPCIMILGMLLRDDNIVRIMVGLTLFAVTFFVTFPPTRTSVIAVIVAYALLRFDRSKSKRARTVAVAAAILLSIPTIMLLNYLNDNRQGVQATASANDEGGLLRSLTKNFYQYDNGLTLIKQWRSEPGTGFSFLGASLSPVNLVPSALVPFEKPRADKEAYLTEIVFGSGLNLAYYAEGSTLTYGIPATATTDFSLIGVSLSAIIFALIIAVVMSARLFASPYLVFFLSYFMVTMVSSMRLSIESFIQQAQITILVLLLVKGIGLVFDPQRVQAPRR